MKEYYNGIYWIKFILAILIIALHTNLFTTFSKVTQVLFNDVLIRAGVPYFFIASSFFLFKKLLKDDKRRLAILKKYVFRIASLYLAWAIVNLPQILVIHSGKTIKDLILQLLFRGIFRGSWYLVALLYAILFVYMLVFAFKLNDFFLFFVCFVLYQIPIFSGFYTDLGDFFNVNNFHVVFSSSFSPYVGMVYVAIGYIIAKYEKDIRLSFSICLVFFLGSLMLSCAEVYLHHGQYRISDNYESLICVGTSLFLLSMSFKNIKKPNSFICQSSTTMYLSQFIVIFFIKQFFAIQNLSKSNITLFLLTLLYTLIISYVVCIVNIRTKRDTLFKYLE